MTPVDRSRLPLPGPEPPFVFPGATRAVLDNGLALRTLERGTLPLVTVLVTLPAGAWIDPPGMAGLASLTADMLDEGTERYSAIEIQETLARLGAELDTDAGYDVVTVSLTLLERHLREGLQLLADVVCRPRLADTDVERVRTLRLNRLRQLRDTPGALAERAFAEALYRDHAYAHLPFGSTASLEGLCHADVVRFHRGAYRPDRATMIIVGPTPVDAVVAAVADTFGAWQPDPRESALPLTSGALTVVPPSVVVVDRPGAAQTELRVGHVGVPRDTAAFHALLVLNSALGGNFVSRLNLTLREQKGYTYGVRTAFEFRRQPGPFSVATSVQTDATADAVAECLREIREIREARPITPDELDLSQRSLTLGYARSFESCGQVARGIAQLVAHDLPDETFAVFGPKIRAQTVESVTAAAQAHLSPERLVVIAVGDLARIRVGLEGLASGPLTVTTPVL